MIFHVFFYIYLGTGTQFPFQCTRTKIEPQRSRQLLFKWNQSEQIGGVQRFRWTNEALKVPLPPTFTPIAS